jgi:chromosome partitioning protein
VLIPDGAAVRLLESQPIVARVIAIANQKGGVGKTTTAVNLAASLAAAEQRTLLIDGDPQGNATSGVGVQPDQISTTVYDVLIGDRPLKDAIIRQLNFTHLDVAPATPDLAGAEVELVDRGNRERMMRNAVEGIRDSYDYVLIDCPPSLGLLTVNGLAAADDVIVPIQCEYYALEGLAQLLGTIEMVQSYLNKALRITTVLLTMYDSRTRLADQVAADVRNHFTALVVEAVIPRNVRVSEAPGYGQTVMTYDPGSRGAISYLQAAYELAGRVQEAVS